MSDYALFPESDAYDGDPVRPDMDTPTPASIVAALTRPDREARVTALISQAHDILDDAIRAHADGRRVVATAILYSGGNDSTTLAHMFRERATHAIHANTTIGIEETREFVRNTCEEWGLPLIERTAPTSYRDLVLERGFPGPAMHFKMYQRLKERALRQAQRELVTDPLKERVVFVAGRRRAESKRRETVPIHERIGSAIWASPLAFWTSLDMNTYRLMHGDVPRNPVSGLLHMSGECLCGAFAHPGELDEIGQWFPGVRDEIKALEAAVRAAGHPEPFCTWGHGRGGKPSESGPMCSSCDSRFTPLPGMEIA